MPLKNSLQEADARPVEAAYQIKVQEAAAQIHRHAQNDLPLERPRAGAALLAEARPPSLALRLDSPSPKNRARTARPIHSSLALSPAGLQTASVRLKFAQPQALRSQDQRRIHRPVVPHASSRGDSNGIEEARWADLQIYR